MIERDVTLVNRLGLHARAASKLVAVAGAHQASLRLGRPGQPPVDGKNIMTVLMLAATCGTTLTLRCEGPDEQALADAVCALVADRFGEGE